jgi:hypothetical protein
VEVAARVEDRLPVPHNVRVRVRVIVGVTFRRVCRLDARCAGWPPGGVEMMSGRRFVVRAMQRRCLRRAQDWSRLAVRDVEDAVVQSMAAERTRSSPMRIPQRLRSTAGQPRSLIARRTRSPVRSTVRMAGDQPSQRSYRRGSRSAGRRVCSRQDEPDYGVAAAHRPPPEPGDRPKALTRLT